MKATSWIIPVALALIAVVLGVLWMNASNRTKDLSKSKAELQQLYDDSAKTLSEIQSSLDAIDKELLGSIDADSELPTGTPEERRASIINSLANARTKIEEYKKQIKDLENKLSASTGQIAGIQSVVNKLKASVADKEKIVSELEGRLANLSSTLETERQISSAEISLREALLKDKESLIANQNVEANRMYYVVGTRKQLLDSGIIDRKGGILGIGKVSTVKDVDLTKFTEFNLLDTQTVTFPVTKKGYAVLSNHVAASYKVEKAADQYQLTVLDQDLFRKQKVLVVELK